MKTLIKNGRVVTAVEAIHHRGTEGTEGFG